MTMWTTMAVVVALLITLVIGTFLAIGADRFWGFFGNPDLGNVTFGTLQRRSKPNDALACPPGFCQAPSDLAPPVYGIPARKLREAFAEVIASEPRVAVMASDEATLTDRYVQRTEILGLPDTIVVRFIDLPDARSTLALYSRSRFGEGDFGVNRARIKRWLTTLSNHVRLTD
jgi:uncharacterized protein (DUF1499 family)